MTRIWRAHALCVIVILINDCARDDCGVAEILLEKCAEHEATLTRVSREEAFACIEYKWHSMLLLPKVEWMWV